LQNAIKWYFKRSEIEGCWFHFKQAIRGWLRNTCRMDETLISMLLEHLNVLTVIPVEEIRYKGLPFVLSQFDLMEDSDKWYKFYEYFLRTWCTYYNPEVRWNDKWRARTLSQKPG